MPDEPREGRTAARRCAGAFSLVELLVVITVVAVVASVVLTSFEPSMHDQVRSAAQIVAADLAAAQSLAVTNNTSYRITFDRGGNLYYLEHSGTNSVFDTLPASPFGLPGDPSTRRTTDLGRLPLGTANVQLHVVQELQTATNPQEVTTLEFGPLGQTTRAADTRIWLTAGRDSAARYLSLSVDPITGIAAIGDYQTESPLAANAASASSSSSGGGTSDEQYSYEYGTGDGGGDDGEGDDGGSGDSGSSDDGTGTSDSARGSYDPGTGSGDGTLDSARGSSESGTGSYGTGMG